MIPPQQQPADKWCEPLFRLKNPAKSFDEWFSPSFDWKTVCVEDAIAGHYFLFHNSRMRPDRIESYSNAFAEVGLRASYMRDHDDETAVYFLEKIEE